LTKHAIRQKSGPSLASIRSKIYPEAIWRLVTRLLGLGRVEGVTVAWWLKTGDEFRGAIAERNRSKLGRMARLTGKVTVTV